MTRVPFTQACPWQICGSTVIRSRQFISGFLFWVHGRNRLHDDEGIGPLETGGLFINL